jgi:capsular polysaccharide transport system permease protein
MIDNIPKRRVDGGLKAQVRVVYALLLREMLGRFGLSRVGYLWLVAEPVMLALGVSGIHWMMGEGDVHGVPVFLFYGLGYAPFFMFRAILTRNASTIQAAHSLLFHRPIKLMDLCLARTILEATACLPVIFLFVLASVMSAGIWPAEPGLMPLVLVISALFAHGMGMLLAALVVFYEPLERFIHPLTYLMMPFSGAFSMIESLPPAGQEALLWSPLVHVHEAFRDAMWGSRIVSHYDLSYPILWALFLNMLGMAALRAARPHVTLSH